MSSDLVPVLPEEPAAPGSPSATAASGQDGSPGGGANAAQSSPTSGGDSGRKKRGGKDKGPDGPGDSLQAFGGDEMVHAAGGGGNSGVKQPLDMKHERLQGYIARYVPSNGWGFVRSHMFEGEVFFRSDRIMPEFQSHPHHEGEAVEFDVEADDNARPHAIALKPVLGRKPYECLGQRHRGYVRRCADRWGFLNAAAFDGDLFVHRDNLLPVPEHLVDGQPLLRAGQTVEFDVALDDRGRAVAKQITTSALLRPCDWIGHRLCGHIRSFQGAWGFINSDRFAGDLFIHQDSLLAQYQGAQLTVGTMVQFDVEQDHHRKGTKNRLVARNVALLGPTDAQQQQSQQQQQQQQVQQQHHQAMPGYPMQPLGGQPPLQQHAAMPMDHMAYAASLQQPQQPYAASPYGAMQAPMGQYPQAPMGQYGAPPPYQFQQPYMPQLPPPQYGQPMMQQQMLPPPQYGQQPYAAQMPTMQPAIAGAPAGYGQQPMQQPGAYGMPQVMQQQPFVPQPGVTPMPDDRGMLQQAVGQAAGPEARPPETGADGQPVPVGADGQPQALLHITMHNWEPDQAGQLWVTKGTLVKVSYRAAHGWVYAGTVQPGSESGKPATEGWIPQAIVKRVSLCRVAIDWPAEGSGTLDVKIGEIIAVSKEAERGWVYGERIGPREQDRQLDGWLPKKVLDYIQS